MWTLEELLEIRERAEQDAKTNALKLRWRHAFLDLAAAADRVHAMSSRVGDDGDRPTTDEYVRSRQAIED